MSSPLPDSAAQDLPILVLVRDLLFATRITATARAANLPVVLLRDEAKLVADQPGRRLIVDLNQPAALEAAVKWKQACAGRTVIGFVSHVDGDTIRRAREAGVDQVLPRSRFVAELLTLLRGG